LDAPAGDPLVHNGVLYVSDWNNSRVLGFSTFPTLNGEAASFAIGQPSLTSATAAATASQFSGPEGTTVDDDGRMTLVDYDNSRVLIFDSPPLATGASANVVVGQSSMTGSGSACTATGMSLPEGAIAVAGKLIVADRVNHRVLIWNSTPTSDGAAANLVLGQANFTSCVSNRGGSAGAGTLSSPYAVWSDGTRLFVADGNGRVLIWNAFPSTNGQAADLVLGQPDMTTTGDTSDQAMIGPVAVQVAGTQLFVADCDANRILIWDSLPTENFAPADHVLGQSDFTHITENDDDQNDIADATSTARTLYCPWGLYLHENKLIVPEWYNNRVLIFEGT
jgi:hypothetical protein